MRKTCRLFNQAEPLVCCQSIVNRSTKNLSLYIQRISESQTIFEVGKNSEKLPSQVYSERVYGTTFFHSCRVTAIKLDILFVRNSKFKHLSILVLRERIILGCNLVKLSF